MSDRKSNRPVRSYIETLREKYGKGIAIIILCAFIFTAVAAIAQFIQVLPFSLPQNLIIALFIILVVAYIVFRPLRTYEYIRYRYLINKGFLMLGPLRDVALRVRTLLILLETMSQRIQNYEAVLRETGRKVGRDFARDFQAVLNSERKLRKKALSLSEKFERWLEYDSKAGMGKFEGELNSATFEGEITVQNSFVTHQRQPSSDQSLCSFMTGYIEGVLQGLSACQDISVSHSAEEQECGFFNKDPEQCVFIIKNKRLHRH